MACAASPVGGEDGPADVAVGGHGCQLPPEGNSTHKVPSSSKRDAIVASGSSEILQEIKRFTLWIDVAVRAMFRLKQHSLYFVFYCKAKTHLSRID